MAAPTLLSSGPSANDPSSTQLTAAIAVSAQIDAFALKRAAQAGIRLVVCNRPDGEEADQPSAHALGRQAHELGLRFLYLPVVPGRFPDQDVAAFRAAFASANGPVLAYCRSGIRSASLSILAGLVGRDMDAAIRKVEASGYDLSRLRAWLQQSQVTPPSKAGAGR